MLWPSQRQGIPKPLSHLKLMRRPIEAFSGQSLFAEVFRPVKFAASIP